MYRCHDEARSGLIASRRSARLACLPPEQRLWRQVDRSGARDRRLRLCPAPGAPFGGSVQSVMNWRPYGPLSKREIRCRRLSYRFSPPIPARLNRFQRMLWRLQRLFLGDTQHKRVQPWRSDARETA
jgi:hypothetical protein